MQDKTAVVNSQIACRTIDGEARIISVQDSRLHQLDPVGTFIWELIERGRGRVGELLDEVVGHFQVERPQALTDLEEFLAELERLGLVTLQGAAPVTPQTER